MRNIFSVVFALILSLSMSFVPVAALASGSPVWHIADQQTNSGNTTAALVARPSNLTRGDLVILIVVKQNSLNTTGPGITPPAGFNLIRYEHDATDTARPEVLAYWKVATDSEPATYNFAVTHDNPQWKAIAGRVTGHRPVNPIGNNSGTNSANSTVTSLAIPGITTSRDNVLLVAAVVARGDDTPPTSLTKPATMNELWAIDGSGSGSDGDPGTGGGSEAFVTEEPTGTRSFSWSGASRAAGLMFEILPATYTLTMAVTPAGSGNATDLTNASPYLAGTEVAIQAVPAPGYRFSNWTAPAGEFDDATALETTFTVPPQNVTVTANFVQLPQVTSKAATDITSYSAIVSMTYSLGGFSTVELRFACKRAVDPSWFYTNWVSKTADGTYDEVLTGLAAKTEYEFKAQLRYDGTVIEGAIRRFTTATGATIRFTDLFCFIATAAYGTTSAKQIDVLREFRDVALLENEAGRLFVGLYYRLSPPIAGVIARSDLLRTIVRELLVDPIVWIVQATGDSWRN
ncbi:MAG: CFI-box-CTERM domain-containing protein [Dehalococcoidia bacterium]